MDERRAVGSLVGRLGLPGEAAGVRRLSAGEEEGGGEPWEEEDAGRGLQILLGRGVGRVVHTWEEMKWGRGRGGEGRGGGRERPSGGL